MTTLDLTAPDYDQLTPVEDAGDGILVKRDDLYTAGGVSGGKVRGCQAVIASELRAGRTPPLITAGARHSPQVHTVAALAHAAGLPCRVHVPSGGDTPELVETARLGAEIVRHTPGYNTVIVARARSDADATGSIHVPFGMEHEEAVAATARQAATLPTDITRIVVAIGSGISAAGILQGTSHWPRPPTVVGVAVGADPTKRLARWAAPHLDRLDLCKALVPYERRVTATLPNGTPLDPVYEAKTLPYLMPGDLLWVVGIRGTFS